MMQGVAPFTGAWIEIAKNAKVSESNAKSHPSRVRGLKFPGQPHGPLDFSVAPFTGAWIEILSGAVKALQIHSRTLHGCVD